MRRARLQGGHFSPRNGKKPSTITKIMLIGYYEVFLVRPRRKLRNETFCFALRNCHS
jgi:hypothetical protein